MNIKQQVNHGAILKVCDLLHIIFHPIHLSHSFDYLDPSSAFPTKSNKLYNERKDDFLYVCCFNVSRHIKWGRKSRLSTYPRQKVSGLSWMVKRYFQVRKTYRFKMSCLICLVFSSVCCFFLKQLNLYKDICSAWIISRTSADIFFSHRLTS